MKTKVTIALSIIAVVILSGLSVHRYDTYVAQRREAAHQAAVARDAAAEQAAIAAEKKRVYDTCIADQKVYDAKTVAQRGKQVRPVCPTALAE